MGLGLGLGCANDSVDLYKGRLGLGLGPRFLGLQRKDDANDFVRLQQANWVRLVDPGAVH